MNFFKFQKKGVNEKLVVNKFVQQTFYKTEYISKVKCRFNML